MRESRILVAVGLMVLLAVPALMAAKPGTEPQSDTKLFYLTAQTHLGSGALGAEVCAAGYHMASTWEFRDLGNLEYAIDVAGAYIADDQGIGPPPRLGWIRTNNESNGGQGWVSNCFTWTAGAGSQGAMLRIGFGPTTPSVEILAGQCDDSHYVWCMQD